MGSFYGLEGSMALMAPPQWVAAAVPGDGRQAGGRQAAAAAGGSKARWRRRRSKGNGAVQHYVGSLGQFP